MREKTFISVHKDHQTDPCGLTGYISWNRLKEALQKAGELKPGQEIVGFNVDTQGIEFRIK